MSEPERMYDENGLRIHLDVTKEAEYMRQSLEARKKHDEEHNNIEANHPHKRHHTANQDWSDESDDEAEDHYLLEQKEQEKLKAVDLVNRSET